MNVTLAEHAAALGHSADPFVVFDTFVDWVFHDKGFELYPAQSDAITAVAMGSNVVLATPTGTGKSTVALGAHFIAFTQGKRTAYTAPIKALVSEKFFELVRVFGAENVGLVTGDFSINADAPILCATAEIVAQYALSDPDCRGITQVVMDEFHYYADRERGWAWQVPLLLANGVQFILMSATLGDVSEVVKTLDENTGRTTEVITGVERPVPLSYRYSLKPVHEEISELVSGGLAPVYVVHFSQAAATEQAQALTSVSLLTKDEKTAIAQHLTDFRFSAGYGQTLNKLLRAGIAVHHAGLLPKYRRLVEQLAQAGLLKVICGTDTLGVGINVPIRTVLLTSLVKFDGVKERRLSAREFHQIAGRAGRAGFDRAGDVVVLAPEHAILNAAIEAKAAAAKNAGKKAKPGKKVAAKAGVTWSEATFEKLVAAEPEPLVSRMQITGAMLVAILSRGEKREGELFAVVRELIQDSHETAESKRKLTLQALKLYRALKNAGVVRVTESDTGERMLSLTVSGEGARAFNQPLALFAIAATELLDAESSGYTLDLLSLFEAVLEPPRQILIAQEKKEKSRVVAELKADGIEYEERMAILAEVTHPQPLRELIEAAFAEYRAKTPSAHGQQPTPKSIVRDMVENAFGFKEFVAHYGLKRSEGVLLRYLSDAYRMLRAGVPEEKRTPYLDDIITWLGELVRQTDSSLLEEWQQLAEIAAATDSGDWNPTLAAVGDAAGEAGELEAPPRSDKLSANEKALTIMVRNYMFRLVMWAEFDDVAALVAASTPPDMGSSGSGVALGCRRGMTKHDWDAALDAYFDEHDEIPIDAAARASRFFNVQKQKETWRVEQVIADPAGNYDWVITAELDLKQTDEIGEPALTVLSFATR
ncbi:DEAD/DEAH box helicase [Canibacter zhoujuaniae]|uniref:DEAD/DEAH box helicase n=1 Tax=Canibacter zhoujuaniae TaxID=2708343 RepID=UPI0014212D06|nr:DUF3516 domain-containing protein [Canibacter zhoujuaniae]